MFSISIFLLSTCMMQFLQELNNHLSSKAEMVPFATVGSGAAAQPQGTPVLSSAETLTSQSWDVCFSVLGLHHNTSLQHTTAWTYRFCLVLQHKQT